MSDARTRGDQDATDPFDAERSDDSDGDGDASKTHENAMAGWFASTAIRWMLVVVGFVLLLFALGQAFNTPLLGWVADAATSETGRWLVVALIAIALIAIATDAPWDRWN